MNTATERMYQTDWNDFAAHCREGNATLLPATPQTIASYVRDRATTLKRSTMKRRLAAISHRHREAGFTTPTGEAEVRAAINALQGETKSKTPLYEDDIADIVATIPETLSGYRDRAVILLGFYSGLGRSELAALLVEDISLKTGGLEIRVGGKKRLIRYSRHASLCTTRRLLDWLVVSEIESGPLFRAINRHGTISHRGLC